MINSEIADELETYAQLEGTELGGYHLDLIEMARRRQLNLPESMKEIIDAEIATALEEYRQNTRIVSRIETFSREVMELEWIDE